MNVPIIKTERLALRPFTLDDVESLYQVLQVPGVLDYFPISAPPEIDRVYKLIQGQLDHWQEHGYGWWAIEPLADPQLIGWSGLQYLPDTDETEIGYLLGRPFWGRGLATESAIASLHFGFHTLQLKRIVGIVHPEHIASQRVLEKIGLQFVRQAEYFGMQCFQYSIDNPG